MKDSPWQALCLALAASRSLWMWEHKDPCWDRVLILQIHRGLNGAALPSEVLAEATNESIKKEKCPFSDLSNT